MKRLLIFLVVMCLSITTYSQALKPNQRTIKKTFTKFKILNSLNSEFKDIGEDFTIKFKMVSPLYYEFDCNEEKDFLPYSVVRDCDNNITYFINEFNIFTWYKKDNKVYLKQEILVGNLKGIVIIFK